MTPRFLLCCLLGVANLAAAPASVWDNPVFQKRLLGSFGFSSEVEPPMSDNERSDYEQILPLIKDAPEQALAYLEKLRALPDSSARFDFLIGNLHFQNNRKPKAAADFVKALALASPGTIIDMAAGTYTETNIVLNTNLVPGMLGASADNPILVRSEERRVGKEC
jgi:hypothetical protein